MWGTPRNPEEQQGERFREADAWNKPLIIRPIEHVQGMKVRDEVRDALKLNVVDLTDGKVYKEILWFSAPLIGAFKAAIGTPFLGYITKEKNANGYMAWKFYDLANDPAWDAAAQAYLAQDPGFLAPLSAPPPAQPFQPRDTSHHEQGPAPDWAGAIPAAPQAPAAPPAPPRPGVGGPPAVPSAPPQPPAPPVSAPPAPAVPGGGGDLMARLRAQAAGNLPGPGGNVGNGDVEPPY